MLRELKDKAFKEQGLFLMQMGSHFQQKHSHPSHAQESEDNPYKLRMVKFLEQKTTAGRLCKKASILSCLDCAACWIAYLRRCSS